MNIVDEMMKLICPKCGQEDDVRKYPSDPENAVACEYPCPSCHGGLGGAAKYYDKDGKVINV